MWMRWALTLAVVSSCCGGSRAAEVDPLDRANEFAELMIRSIEAEVELSEIECPDLTLTTATICRVEATRNADRFKSNWDRHAEPHLSPRIESVRPGSIVTMRDWHESDEGHSKTYAVSLEAFVTVFYGDAEERGMIVVGVGWIPTE
jgi:hypothetical protein